jgi:sensor histidine kinase YesM
MILQPIVENAIKHGISHRTDGGVVRITARNEGDGLEITIENDGLETGELELAELVGRGMGLRNVTERLQIYACGEGGISITPRQAGGAVVSIHLPRIDEEGKTSVDTSDHCR